MIPSYKCDDVIFSDTYAKFTADLMADVSRALLAITTKLDQDLKFNRPGSREYLRAQTLSVDKPVLVSAACYCQWISEHLRYEVTQWRVTDLLIEEGYAFGDQDKAALCRLERQDTERLAPEPDAPVFPGALQEVHRTHLLTSSERAKRQAEIAAGRHGCVDHAVIDLSDDGYAHRLALIRETINTAANAMSRNKTKKTDVLRGHVTAVAIWLG
ncbi:hypothetical protein A5658_02570 [Mycobacterium sp. 1245111.1]|uniref:hypothetical protein n=1 Tax=Mycobacterium sp. 1245111.1 TaxID=1834073 RepID=UPI000801DFA5|nr:hypothetical protein [Mycobacterium sp. 1245111.1]OBK41147.1 hypothetical protein A5658_02570 [Mycobacterium sp. 1245111.1]